VTLFKVLSFLCAWGWMLWLAASIAIRLLRIGGRRAWPVVRRFQAEVRPFALLLLIGMWLPNFLGHMSPWDYLSFGMGLLSWVLYRNEKDDDDDRWKKRLEKLSGKVAEVGGRLKVVPVGASS
jgi:hypothetical protein